jgi:meso-butanediol dehydrogenase / (S,S)-butanediol dehydrogenase / diacetyl reductase
MTQLSKKTCLITGAARGIGKALAHGLAKEGATVVVADIDEGGAQETAAGFRAEGLSAVAVRMDVTDKTSATLAAQFAVEQHGSLDVLINNAGISGYAPLDDIDWPFFDRVMRINVFGVIACTQAAADIMRRQGHGKIINMCSIAGKRGYPNNSIYSASKFGVRALTYSYAQELAQHGITVNAICPGAVETSFWDEISNELAKRGQSVSSREIVSSRGSAILLGRHAQPEDIVGLARFLSSADSDYMTGQCINIDGGMVLE